MQEHVHDPNSTFETLTETFRVLADCPPEPEVDAIRRYIDGTLQWNEEGSCDFEKLEKRVRH